jgi:hypothetical protein
MTDKSSCYKEVVVVIVVVAKHNRKTSSAKLALHTQAFSEFLLYLLLVLLGH